MNAQDITNELEKLKITNNNIELDKQSTLPQHISSEWEIDFDHPLGKGNFSDGVYKARKLDGIINGISIPNNGECVVKIVRKQYTEIGLRELEIIDLLLQLKHLKTFRHVIQYYGYAFSNGKCYIYMEYLKGIKSITKVINDRDDKRLKDEEITIITISVYLALHFIHKFDIIHCDIKCDNILYNEITGEVKIIDFGMSKIDKIKSSTYYSSNHSGTPLHMSPESKNGTPTKKSDIWSLGCTIIKMAGGDLERKENGAPMIPDSFKSEFRLFFESFLFVDPFLRGISDPSFLEEYGLYQDIDRITIESDSLGTPGSQIEPTKNYLSLLNFNYQKHSLDSIPLTIAILEIEEAIPAFYIPSSIKYITFRLFNQPITPNMVPTTVSILDLPSYNLPIAPNSIPKSIKSLSIESFNHDLDEFSLPESLISLYLGESFNFNEYGYFPSSLKILICYSNFNKPLKRANLIPKNVNLLFLFNFNQPITSESIPKSVIYLALGSNYTHIESLSKLPKTVKTLDLKMDDLNDEKKKKILENTSAEEVIVNGKYLRGYNIVLQFIEGIGTKMLKQLYKQFLSETNFTINETK